MQQVTRDWLLSRGGLHDARITCVQRKGVNLVVRLDDEWANEHDEPEDAQPVELVLQEADVLEGDLDGVLGGWVSEIRLDGDQVLVACFDRPKLVLRSRAISCAGSVSRPR